jgi:bilirubin oxidase
MYLSLLSLKLACFCFLSVPVLAEKGRSSTTAGSRADQSRVIGLTRPSPTSGQGPLQSENWISPEYKWFYEYPLPLTPVKSKKQ